jgi:hypothetical protein
VAATDSRGTEVKIARIGSCIIGRTLGLALGGLGVTGRLLGWLNTRGGLLKQPNSKDTKRNPWSRQPKWLRSEAHENEATSTMSEGLKGLLALLRRDGNGPEIAAYDLW